MAFGTTEWIVAGVVFLFMFGGTFGLKLVKSFKQAKNELNKPYDPKTDEVIKMDDNKV